MTVSCATDGFVANPCASEHLPPFRDVEQSRKRRRAGFRDRGTLREGAAADIIVYDYEKLDYEFPTFRHDLPGDEYRITSAGSGYRYVLVNGKVTIEDDKPTNVHSGVLLRGGRTPEQTTA